MPTRELHSSHLNIWEYFIIQRILSNRSWKAGGKERTKVSFVEQRRYCQCNQLHQMKDNIHASPVVMRLHSPVEPVQGKGHELYWNCMFPTYFTVQHRAQYSAQTQSGLLGTIWLLALVVVAQRYKTLLHTILISQEIVDLKMYVCFLLSMNIFYTITLSKRQQEQNKTKPYQTIVTGNYNKGIWPRDRSLPISSLFFSHFKML